MDFYPGQCFGYKKRSIPIQTKKIGKPEAGLIEAFSDYWLIVGIDETDKSTYYWVKYTGNKTCGRHSKGYVTYDIRALNSFVTDGLLEEIEEIPTDI